MSLLEEYRYGPLEMELENSSIRRRRDGLDTGTIKFITQSPDSFPPGTLVPGYGLEIEESEHVQEGVTDWLHTLMVVGVWGSRPERRELGYPQINKQLTGFDEMVDSIITRTPDNYDRGTFAAGFSDMVCVSSPRTELWRGWYRVQPHYQGLIGSKPYQRTMTVNEEVVNPSNPVVISLSGGWADPRKAQLSLPKVMIKDTRVVLSASDSAAIPGPNTPPDAPSIQLLSLTGSNLSYRWPHGWKLAAIDRAGEIPGTTICLETLSYEYVWAAVFE